MRSRSLFLAAALAAALPAAALAQDPYASDATAEPGYGTLVSSLQTADAELAELEALEGVALADVQVVDVDDVLADDQSVAFDQARIENEAEIAALQEFLNTTDIQIVGDENVALSFSDVLAESDAGVGDVVAVNVSGGQVTLFVLEDTDEETEVEGMTS